MQGAQSSQYFRVRPLTECSHIPETLVNLGNISSWQCFQKCLETKCSAVTLEGSQPSENLSIIKLHTIGGGVKIFVLILKFLKNYC